MQAPPTPENEDQRLTVLHKLDILDSPPEERFDRISTIAKKLFDVPVVLITLVDESRQWFKSCLGLDIGETERDISFCGHAILGNQLFEVTDALQDSRFCDNPLVTGSPGIRFYAGVPVPSLDGSNLGTLCLIDTRPRQLDDKQRDILVDLAALVAEQFHLTEVRQLEHELSHAKIAAETADLRAAVDSKLPPLLENLGSTIEALADSQPDLVDGELQLPVRQALAQLQDISDALEEIISPESPGMLSGSRQASTLDDLNQEFLATSHDWVERLRVASAKDDLKEFVRQVRKFNTIAHGIGATTLVAYCSDLQALAWQRKRSSLQERLEHFPAVLKEVRESIDKRVASSSPLVERLNPGDFTGSILIVDDEPFVLKVTAHTLEGVGFSHVLTAETGQQALELLGTVAPEVCLVLLDLNMPDMDGVELLRRFDELRYAGDILLFSGENSQTLNMAEGLAKARGLSVLGSIGKPVQQDRLLELLAARTPRSTRTAKSARDSQVTAEMLEAAIEAGELEPWFQPKIDIATRRPVGVEMLARWPNSSIGPVYPDEFIPVAETSGLIDRLTFMLIAKAAVVEREWRARSVHLKIAVNVSMRSLQALHFPRQLEDVVQKAGGDLKMFLLEVTESSLMEDLVTPLDVLLRLHLKKVRLSIDDFGTGHSNLSQLRDLPFDELKLDRSYVRGKGLRSNAILESSVEIAKKMNMKIVAEGVETLDDWQRVERLGCDQVQGWFCAKAMPGDAILQWVDAWESQSRKLFVE